MYYPMCKPNRAKTNASQLQINQINNLKLTLCTYYILLCKFTLFLIAHVISITKCCKSFALKVQWNVLCFDIAQKNGIRQMWMRTKPLNIHTYFCMYGIIQVHSMCYRTFNLNLKHKGNYFVHCFHWISDNSNI